MPAPKIILDLIEKFSLHLEEYKSGQYNEAQVRREFIDPFFKALGWDVDNEKSYAEAYKEVIHEDAIKIGGLTKAPDYCFRLGGNRKFFVEAKKPSVDVKEDIHPAFQLRRYVWSAKLPLSILTDFEEFAVYDGRVRPDPKDKSSVARTLYMTYRDYANRWEELVSLFSPDAILKGSFDRYAQSAKIKRGTATVDEVFLKEIESWRNELARNIALRNDTLTQRELNFAVQQTIDRVIFLRICEDRGIEPYGQLMALQNGVNVYERLVDLFRRADDRYNSGLFHFKKEKERDESPDTLTLSLTIDDKVLKDIFKNLYYPDSPYEFSVLSADILGQVYEQFLGKVIRLTDGHRAVVEDKPETKKAGGVYYTPSYIVDYIVKHTLGKMLESRRPKQIAGLSVLDPACGSGSFLIVAYQYLLDWYRDRYIEDGPEKHAKKSKPLLFRGPGGDWRLTTAERKRILLEHIYGVDIDAQAVEVTKLSLLLKVLEGESGESLKNQLRLFQERALPDLGSNIKCGNSLIGPDFYEGQQMSMAGTSDEDRLRINVFDWEGEFSKVMKSGGFDAVVGNPPYVFARDEGFSKHEKTYFKQYKHQNFQLNTFALFIEKAFNLLKEKGKFGFIIPNNWLSIGTMKPLRDFIVSHTGETVIVNNLFKVFVGASVDTSILFFVKTKPATVHLLENIGPGLIQPVAEIKSSELLTEPIIQFRLYKQEGAKSIMKKIEKCSKPLQDIALVRAGLKAYETGIGNPPQTDKMKKERVYHSQTRIDKTYRQYLDGKDVKRYLLDWSGMFLKYGENLAAPRSKDLFDGDHILIRQIPSRPPYSINGMIVEGEYLNDINSMIVKATLNYSLRYILGIVNSRLLTFWFDYQYDKFQRTIFPQFKVNELALFPVCTIDFSNPIDKSHYDKMSSFVETMLDLHKQLAAARTDHEKNSLQRQITATDRQIDNLVYELYGLTEEEIEIVEENKT